MPKVTEVYVEATFTKSLPNYQNYKPTAGVRMVPAKGETTEEVFSFGWGLVHDEIAEQLKAFDDNPQYGTSKGLGK